MNIPHRSKKHYYLKILTATSTLVIVYWAYQSYQQLLLLTSTEQSASLKQSFLKQSTLPSSASKKTDSNRELLLSKQRTQQHYLPSPVTIPPTSLQQTKVDGMFTVDSEGHLITSQTIKERFDYFLSMIGEDSLEQVVARLSLDIDQQLVSPAKEEAHALLSNYLDYKLALADYQPLIANNVTTQAPQEHLLELFQQHRMSLMQLRHQFFSSTTVDAFFGFDQQYDDWINKQLVINNHPTLSSGEKAAALTQLNNSLPSTLQTVFNPNKREAQLKSVVDQLRKRGATSEEIYMAREAIIGEAAANRLGKLDQAKSHWQQRLNYFRQAYKDVKTKASPEIEQYAAIKQLLNQQFTRQEQLRVKVVEQLPDELFHSISPTY